MCCGGSLKPVLNAPAILPKTMYQKRPLFLSSSIRLDIPRLTICLAGLDFLAGLLDLLENSIVVERVLGDNLGSLGLEGDVVGVNTCDKGQQLRLGRGGGGRD